MARALTSLTCARPAPIRVQELDSGNHSRRAGARRSRHQNSVLHRPQCHGRVLTLVVCSSNKKIHTPILGARIGLTGRPGAQTRDLARGTAFYGLSPPEFPSRAPPALSLVSFPCLQHTLVSSLVRPQRDEKNFTTKLPRTTLGTGLARTGTNTATQVHNGSRQATPARAASRHLAPCTRPPSPQASSFTICSAIAV